MASRESDPGNAGSAEPISTHPDVPTTQAHEGESEMPTVSVDDNCSSPASSASSATEGDGSTVPGKGLQRPMVGDRKESSTNIVHRDSPHIELENEEYDEDDARTMSPRRTSEEVEKMGNEARLALQDQARQLQASLLEVVERVESVKSEHEKLEGGNRFLQSYIGELMQTSKITSTGPTKGKSKGKLRTTK